MKINIKAQHIELTPEITDYIDKRFGGLSKFENERKGEAVAFVEIEKSEHHHAGPEQFSTKVNLDCAGIRVRAEATDADLFATIDRVKDELARELVSKKQKRTSLTRWGGQKIKNIIKGLRGGEADGDAGEMEGADDSE